MVLLAHMNLANQKLLVSNAQELYFLCDSETPGGVSENIELAGHLNSTEASGYVNLSNIISCTET